MNESSLRVLGFVQLGELHPGREQRELERVSKFRPVSNDDWETAKWFDGFERHIQMRYPRSKP